MRGSGGMQEALKRMESGEDPEKIEEDMGDLLEADPFAGETEKKSTERRIPRRPAAISSSPTSALPRMP